MSDLECRVEETSDLENAGKTDKKSGFEIRRCSGPTPVARGKRRGFKPRPLVIGVRVGLGSKYGWECLEVHIFTLFFGKW